MKFEWYGKDNDDLAAVITVGREVRDGYFNLGHGCTGKGDSHIF